MNKAYKIQLYPNRTQELLLNKTIRNVRFIYNQMLGERINIYDKLKNDKEKLYTYKYKTEKEYKKEYKWLKEVSSYALQQSRIDLETAYNNFFRRLRQGNKKVGFPRFKSKKTAKQSFRINQTSSNILKLENNKLKLSKYGWIKCRGLSKNFTGIIKSVAVERRKDGKYIVSILVEHDKITKSRKSNNYIGIDFGLKEFIFCSNGEFLKGIKNKLYQIEKEIKKIQKHHARKQTSSNRKEKCRLKLAKLYQYKTDFLNHFQWHLANKLCNENQVIYLEDLNVNGMIKNRKLSHAIHYVNWNSFIIKLEQKAVEYDSQIIKIDRWFPSSKLCSRCGKIKEDLTLLDRIYTCDCGLEIDRDLNASINIFKAGLNALSLEYSDYRHGENVRPIEIIYNFDGQFSEKCLS